MLKFFGRGSAFSESHNNAFFIDGGELVLTDCSMTSFGSIVELCGSRTLSHIYVIVTHTHSDHVSGIGILIHYAFFCLHIPVTVAVPSDEVGADLNFLLEDLDGCDPDGYEIVPAASLKWVKNVIPTRHSARLAGKCFGYRLDVCGEDTVYTGDTCTLEPFIPFITPQSVLYTEIAASRSPVHLYLYDNVDTLRKMAENGTRVFLMHIDNEKEVSQAVAGSLIRLAPLADPDDFAE